MTKGEALQLCEELWNMVGEYPYADAAAIQRAQRIEFLFDSEPQASEYIREKACSVASSFSYWFTDRRWRQYGDDPSRLRGIVFNNIDKLRMAIQSFFPDEVEETGR